MAGTWTLLRARFDQIIHRPDEVVELHARLSCTDKPDVGSGLQTSVPAACDSHRDLRFPRQRALRALDRSPGRSFGLCHFSGTIGAIAEAKSPLLRPLPVGGDDRLMAQALRHSFPSGMSITCWHRRGLARPTEARTSAHTATHWSWNSPFKAGHQLRHARYIAREQITLP